MATTSYRHLVKRSDKLHDFLMNPKSRPDLQTPEGQRWLAMLDHLQNSVGDKMDPLTPWLTREWKKGRLQHADEGTIGHAFFHKPIAVDPYTNEPTAVERKPITHLKAGHWADFLQSNHPLKREMGDIMQHDVHSFNDRVVAWGEAMKDEANQKAAEEAAKGGEVVHQWPDNWSVRRLHTPEELKAEGNAMGHCVGGYHEPVKQGRTSIYSLRDPNGIPHVTTEIRPHYVEDEAGHRHKMDFLEGPFNSHEVIPHKGEVEQIQGAANGDPKPEYKQRMREWFETMNPEDRPKHEDISYDIDNIHEAEPHHFKHPEDQFDEYGLRQPPTKVNWDGVLEDFENEPRYSEYHLYPEDVTSTYNLAKTRGEIPQLGKAFTGFRENVWDDLQKKEEDNWEWHHEAVGPHPEIREEELDQMDPEERQERAQLGWRNAEPEYYTNEYEPWDDQKRKEAEEDYNHREEEVRKELEREHYGAQHLKTFEEHLKPHENPRTGEYQNEPYDPKTDPEAIKNVPPTTFSSWHM